MRRRITIGLVSAAGVAALVAGCSAGPASPEPGAPATGSSASAPGTPDASPSPAGAASPTPAPRELPRGGTELFPKYRLVGYSGAPDAPGQGRLGIGKLDDRLVEMEKRFTPYGQDREVLPTMELIATTVHATPGKDGMYRTRIDDAVIEKWLTVARRHKAILLLNIQPGRADFLSEVKAYEKWLKEPDVGLALDPEWAVDDGQVPGRVFGHTTGKELNGVAAWVSALVEKNRLPQKALVYHQLNPGVVRKESELTEHSGVALIKSVDGIGSPAAKTDTWKRIVKTLPKHVYPGFKLFYEEDAEGSSRVMTPKEVLALKPRPGYVLYE